jgi:RNA polymerase sigma factor (sigma-70 family)
MDTFEKNFIEQLYIQYANTIQQYALRKLKNQEIANDLLQEVFVLSCVKVAELQAHPNKIGWLYKTANTLIMRVQCDRTLNTLSLDEYADLPAEPYNPPLDLLLPITLSDTERKILVLRFEGKLSFNDIGKQLGLSAGNCRVILSRTLKKADTYIS